MDKELKEYQQLIGDKEYLRQYHQLYSEAKQHNGRYSGKEYENSKDELNQIREKYKNGVSKEIINKMLGIKE